MEQADSEIGGPGNVSPTLQSVVLHDSRAPYEWSERRTASAWATLGRESQGDDSCSEQSSHPSPIFQADQTQGKKHHGSPQAPRAEEAPGFSCEPQSPFRRLVGGMKGEGSVREGEGADTDL